MTIAARVPSRDSCSSAITPGNRVDTAVESTGMRAGCPDASWITRTTLMPSTTTQIASSSDQLGRDRRAPLHRPVPRCRRSGRPTTTTPCRAHPAAASRSTPPPGRCATLQPRSGWASGRTSPPRAAPAGRPTTPAIHRSARAGPRRRRRPRQGRWPRRRRCSSRRRNDRPSAAPSALITYGPLMPARDNVQMICAASSCLAVRVGRRQVLQVDAGTAVAAAHTRSCRRRRASPGHAA